MLVSMGSVPVRVQVILDPVEREGFRQRAQREGVSLSAWLREAGRERLAAEGEHPRLETAADYAAFFEACDARELGREPDWSEHLRVIES